MASGFNTEMKGVFASKGIIETVEVDATDAITNYPDLKVKIGVQVPGLSWVKNIELPTWFAKDNDTITGVGTTWRIDRLFRGNDPKFSLEKKAEAGWSPSDYADFLDTLTPTILGSTVYFLEYANRVYNGKVKYQPFSTVLVYPEDNGDNPFEIILADFKKAEANGYLRNRLAYRPELLDGGAEVTADPTPEDAADLPF